MNALGVICCVGFFVIVGCQSVLLHWYYSRHSNWRWLNRRYPAPQSAASGRRRVFTDATIRVNQHWYCRLARVTLNSAGLEIQTHSPLLRLFHKPLFIPWDDVTVEGVEADGLLLLQVGDSTKLTLTETLATGAIRFLERRADRIAPRHRAKLKS